MSRIYRSLRRNLGLKLFPSIYNYKNPFRILEYRELMKETSFTGDERVLDLGCGAGIQTCCLAREAGRVTGLDICDLGVAEENRRRVQGRLDVDFVNSRLQDAPFEDGSFDKIISICVLEHMPDHVEVLSRCFQLLRPGGELILSVDSLATIDGDIRRRHQHEHSVVDYYDREGLRELLEQSGFSDVRVRPILTSGTAERMFIDGIERGYAYSPGGALTKYAWLQAAEWINRSGSEGIFLVASCRKQVA